MRTFDHSEPARQPSLKARARLTCGIVALLVAAPAAADRSQAILHSQRAAIAYGLGRFGEAAIEYERAFDADPQPALLFDAAQAHRAARHLDRALMLYNNLPRLYGAHAPGAATAHKQIELLQQLVARSEPQATDPIASEARVFGVHPVPRDRKALAANHYKLQDLKDPFADDDNAAPAADSAGR